ncbi:hypothetical protein SMMN14_01326, partial [Sphaerulina musiva]
MSQTSNVRLNIKIHLNCKPLHFQTSVFQHRTVVSLLPLLHYHHYLLLLLSSPSQHHFHLPRPAAGSLCGKISRAVYFLQVQLSLEAHPQLEVQSQPPM